MPDQLRSFELRPLPRTQFVPVNVVFLWTIRPRRRSFRDNRHAIHQQPVLPDLLAAVEAGTHVKLCLAHMILRKTGNFAARLGVRGDKRVQFLIVDVSFDRTPQSLSLPMANTSSGRALLFRSNPARRARLHPESVHGWNA